MLKFAELALMDVSEPIKFHDPLTFFETLQGSDRNNQGSLRKVLVALTSLAHELLAVFCHAHVWLLLFTERISQNGWLVRRFFFCAVIQHFSPCFLGSEVPQQVADLRQPLKKSPSRRHRVCSGLFLQELSGRPELPYHWWTLRQYRGLLCKEKFRIPTWKVRFAPAWRPDAASIA